MSLNDAKDGQIPEGTSTPADPLEAGQSAALGSVDDLRAESGLMWVQTQNLQSETVEVMEIWEPADKGDYAPLLIRNNRTGEYQSMRLRSRIFKQIAKSI